MRPYQLATSRLCPYVELEPANVLLVDVAMLTLSETMRGHGLDHFREVTADMDPADRQALRLRLARAVGSQTVQDALMKAAKREAETAAKREVETAANCDAKQATRKADAQAREAAAKKVEATTKEEKAAAAAQAVLEASPLLSKEEFDDL